MGIIEIKWIFGRLVEIKLIFFKSNFYLNFLGCVMFEIITLRPLFPGTNELDQINKIHEVLGSPSSSTLEKFQQ